jgi:hypothetical protein
MKKKFLDGIKLFDTLIEIVTNNQTPNKSQLIL